MHFLDTVFEFKQTDLFNFLNAPDNIEGQYILGKYKQTKSLDYYRLTDMLIWKQLKEDKIWYK